MNIEEHVRNNKTYNLLNKNAIQKAQKLIEKNEKVLCAVVTNISIETNNSTSFKNQKQLFGGAMQLKNVLSGVIVITDRRIVFCNVVLGTINQKQMLIKDIMSIDEHINGLTKTGELRIKGMTETFVIKILKRGINQEIEKAIDLAMNNINIDEKNSVMSNADEIRKYKQLLDEGIITREEFEKKKNELL